MKNQLLTNFVQDRWRILSKAWFVLVLLHKSIVHRCWRILSTIVHRIWRIVSIISSEFFPASITKKALLQPKQSPLLQQTNCLFNNKKTASPTKNISPTTKKPLLQQKNISPTTKKTLLQRKKKTSLQRRKMSCPWMYVWARKHRLDRWVANNFQSW